MPEIWNGKIFVPLQKREQKSQITVLPQTDEKFCQGKLEVPAKSKTAGKETPK